MRSNDIMMDLILKTAELDNRVRAVLMNGSRVNINAKKDLFQDYDIVYVVRDIKTFTEDHSWINVFGERIMLQMPEAMEYPPAKNDGRFNYLMLFCDGNRIDLTLLPIDLLDELFEDDSLTEILLDKDHIFNDIEEPSDIDYWVKKPKNKEFEDLCNEFLWLTTNVAKGLWREELTYSKFMYSLCHDILLTILKWDVGVRTGFTISVGKLGKNLNQYISKGEWMEFRNTYVGYKFDEIWEGLFRMVLLFNTKAINLSSVFNYTYPLEDYNRVVAYLERVRILPREKVNF